MDDTTTYNVRVYRTEVYKGTKVTTYKVRWKTAHRLWKEGFRNAALADSFRSSLLTAARKGEAFSLATGRPASWQRIESAVTWYDLVLDYVAAKWPYAAPNHRKSIAEALADATEAMLAGDKPPYPIDDIRCALRTWAFSDRLRGAPEPPKDLAAIVTWLKTATIPVSELARPAAGAARCRALLERISRKQDGTAAAANTANRKRAVLNNLMQYAVETGVLSANPLKAVKWTRPRTLRTVTRGRWSTATRPGGCRSRSASKENAASGWSPSSVACTTRRCGPKKPWNFAPRTSPACPTTAGANLS
jgi:hypothetical protein